MGKVYNVNLKINACSNQTNYVLKVDLGSSHLILVGGENFVSDSKNNLYPPFASTKKVTHPSSTVNVKKISPPLMLIFYTPKFNCFSQRRPFYDIY